MMISSCFPFSADRLNAVESVSTTTTAISTSPRAASCGRPRSSSLSFLNAAEQRVEVLEELSQYESHLMNLTSQMEEFKRELHIESALLRAELKAAEDKAYQCARAINNIDYAMAECRQKLDDCSLKMWKKKQKTEKDMSERKKIIQKYVSEANRLRLRSRLESFEDDGSMKSLVIHQTQMIEVDEKVNEIIEFEMLEEEAKFQAQWDSLATERVTAAAEKRVKLANRLELQMQLDRLQGDGDEHLCFMISEIDTVKEAIQQGNKILSDLDSGEFRPLHKSLPNLIDIDGSPTAATRRRRDGGGAEDGPTPRTPKTTTAPFDLRAYIELRGHRLADVVAVDNHFRIDGSSCRGFLTKLSAGRSYLRPGHKWLTRWFVLDASRGTLSYYHHKFDENRAAAAVVPRESIGFRNIRDVQVNVVTSNGKTPRYTIAVKTARRTFHLSATTDQATRVWADVIFYGTASHRVIK